VFVAVDILLIILAIFLPPVSVFLKRGCDIHLLINIRTFPHTLASSSNQI
jgi:uncharacterized membrane protein YqaE (UPF0057 family)